MVKNCPMRHENGNCLPAGGFCTANKNICEALLNAYGMGKAQLSQEGTTPSTADANSRQAAIDAVDAIGHIATLPDGDEVIRKSAVKYTLSMLPPAQPEERTEKRTEKHECNPFSRT